MDTLNQSVIEVKNIKKIYKLYNKPSDRIKETLFKRSLHNAFYALDDVSFDVRKGECLGIIGENGAGKSTLLKVLAKTIMPSSGTINITGRVGSLLELGSDFHPELSGRQNYYMSATLMGLSKQEILEREQEIFEFAEIGPFADQPVRTYSSGMYVRLGFSIATSIDPDIIIIDEALSVGDEYFQKKSIDRMRSFRERGKTIVFCSHSLYYINLLCERAMWIKKGKIAQTGTPDVVCMAYENSQRDKLGKQKSPIITPPKETYKKSIRITDIDIITKNNHLKINHLDDLIVDISTSSEIDQAYSLGIGIVRNDIVSINLVNLNKTHNFSIKQLGVKRTRIIYPQIPLYKGKYFLEVYVIDEQGLHIFDKRLSETFEILPHENYKFELGITKMNLVIQDK